MRYLLIILAVLSSNFAQAQWDGNSDTVNNIVSTIPDSFGPKLMLNDGFGGAVIIF